MNFFSVCGAPKSGTTSIYNYIENHPEACVSNFKETRFFKDRYSRGLDWFKSLFDCSPDAKVWGEATPGNMSHKNAPKKSRTVFLVHFLFSFFVILQNVPTRNIITP